MKHSSESLYTEYKVHLLNNSRNNNSSILCDPSVERSDSCKGCWVALLTASVTAEAHDADLNFSSSIGHSQWAAGVALTS